MNHPRRQALATIIVCACRDDKTAACPRVKPPDPERRKGINRDILARLRGYRRKWPTADRSDVKLLEQAKGIEPSSSGWEPEALPLSYACNMMALPALATGPDPP